MPQVVTRTIILSSRGWVILLGIFGFGLIYQFLLLLVLVLAVVGLLGGSDGTLVAEAVEDAGGKGGPPQNLERTVSVCCCADIVTAADSPARPSDAGWRCWQADRTFGGA
jgi:hypothetical protein